MTVQPSVLNAILSLENVIQSRWIQRSLLLCPDEIQCITAGKILSAMDYTVEVITQKEIDNERDNYTKSIDRLRKGLSKVLVTTKDIFEILQQYETDPLYFDVVV